MKVIITSSYKLRDQNITSYYSFPKWSKNIEETLCSQFDFLKRQGKPFELSFMVSEKNS